MPYNWDAPIKIRDLRNGDWFWVHKGVWADKKLNASDKVVYGTLAYFSNQKTQTCFPSLTRICEFANISRPTVASSLRNLIKFHYVLKKKTKGKVNVYTLVKNFNQLSPTSKKSLLDQLKRDPRLVKKRPTNNNYIKRINNNITNINISKGNTHGNQNINQLIGYFKEKLGLPMLDGSQKQNRHYCWLALKKFDGLDKMKLLIDAAANDEFWKTRITSFQSLYYKGVQIISKTREGKNAVAVL